MAKSPNDVPEEAREFARKVAGEMRQKFKATVLPIYALSPEHDHYRTGGSGALLDLAGWRFLVTAYHVVAAIRPADLSKPQVDEIHAPDENGLMQAISGQLSSDGTKTYDVAVIRLDEQSTDALKHVAGLRVDDMDLGAGWKRPGLFYVCGWPEVWRRSEPGSNQLKARPFIRRLRLSKGPPSRLNALENFEPTVHIALSDDQPPPEVPIKDEPEAPADLHGISGCPIWRAFPTNASRSLLKTWSVDDAKVVAVETGVYDRATPQIVKGVTWKMVLEIICRAYPEVRRALAIIRV
jgi:hypothetical protein